MARFPYPQKSGVLLLITMAAVLMTAVALSFAFPGDPGPSGNAHSHERAFSDCVTRIEPRTVNGTSLSGVVEAGDDVQILFGYYDCNPVIRGDIVAYDFAGNDNPVIKIVHGLPGDTFALAPVDGEDWYYLIVNSEQAVNFAGEPHFVHRTNRRFPLYIRDYGDGIPADTYLLLGTNPRDAFDSRTFGLVHISDILGKAILE